jgi:hypothetical protein
MFYAAVYKDVDGKEEELSARQIPVAFKCPKCYRSKPKEE